MLETFLDASSVNYFVAYVAGFITFFASCLLPLVPTYLAYLSGVSLHSDQAELRRWYIFRVSAMFVAGFVSTFVILGLFMNHLGSPIQAWRPLIERVAGFIFVVLGLYILGVFKQSWLAQEHRPQWSKLGTQLLGENTADSVHRWLESHTYLHSFLVGIGFAFGWTPCIGPVLAVILFWAGHADSAVAGASLLLAYGIGLGTPFLITGLLFDRLIPILKKSHRFTKYLHYFAGVFIIISGVLLATGQFQLISMWLIRLFNLRALAV